MPELPEVEAVARAIRPLVVGRKILRAEVIHSIAARPSSRRGERKTAALLESRVRGRRVCGVLRRGKYLLLALDGGCLALHFRLDGQLVWFDSREIQGHIDVAFHFRRGILGFVDRRHFGRVQWLPKPESLPGIRDLGLDPLSREFTPESLEPILRGSHRPLKLLLLDQSRIAGLGNIYSSEALWRARLDPRRRANRVTPEETCRLHKAIVGVLRRALECCLHPAPDFRDPGWWFQGLEDMLCVYGRVGKRCPRCSGKIVRRIQGGRSSFFCPRCQR